MLIFSILINVFIMLTSHFDFLATLNIGKLTRIYNSTTFTYEMIQMIIFNRTTHN